VVSLFKKLLPRLPRALEVELNSARDRRVTRGPGLKISRQLNLFLVVPTASINSNRSSFEHHDIVMTCMTDTSNKDGSD
jgi:hypothetical protein